MRCQGYFFKIVLGRGCQSHAFNHQVDSGLRRFILLLNEEDEARNIPGFMTMSDCIRRKLFFQGKVFYCARCYSKHTFYKAAGEPTAQEGGAKARSGDESELESDYPSANDETQQQPNAVV